MWFVLMEQRGGMDLNPIDWRPDAAVQTFC